MSEFYAVILADNYDNQFNHLTNTLPKSLFPFVDDLIIEHQINWLSKNEIDQIIILYRNEKIAEYFNNRKRLGRKTQNIQLINILDSKSSGDALRELYSHGIIQQDFLLLFGDVITNISLKDAINKYHDQRKEDKMNILLMVAHQGIQQYEEERFLYVLENDDKLFQLIDLQQKQIKFNKKHITLTKGMPCKYVIRSNLIESGIYICNRDVLKSFQENFMWAEIKEDFIKYMTTTSDIQEEKIHLYIAPKTQVCQRIFHPQSYHNACLKYLSRFFFPYCPQQQYYVDFFKYFAGRVDQKSKISDQCFIGQNTDVKPKVTITKSIIGKNCKLGIGCEIINSILWDNIEVDDNIIIKDCIVASGCKIKGSIQSQIVTMENQKNVKQLSNFQKYDENAFQSEDSDQESDSHELHQKKPKENDDQGLKEDMIDIVAKCQTVSQVRQAIINVDTIKVNSNIAFENIVIAFMAAFLDTLQPDIDSLKNAYALWEEFIVRFVSETEVVCYIKSIETFCRQNQQYHLNQFLQLSYKHQILSEQVILNYQNQMAAVEDDQFAKEFTQSSQQFKEYLENIIAEQEQQQTQEEQGDGEYEYEYVYE
ncbi:unnamed protein product (macronuclear) [Paramecium tetraurelia]|uniref:W2 domain-containing protein n=1 Tax=Paramecium tetraurelia TaxID=5888 RepID=A0CKT0_PARTE|nr:uncharacterized protein GSPATT00007943001 [Paramecium tetraurelia]CAK71397.1 unnamed protein product [Paramecium tetraurelia]|eukprot:XP_001438794.1 hypothetical protein (macronuclear) [Paramecium tetraurelia strain d4-2]